MKVFLSAEADSDFDEIVAWYENERIGLGAEFATELLNRLEQVAAMPESFAPLATRKRANSFRTALLRWFPYVVVFACRESRIEVVAIAHVRRGPNFLRDRLG